MQGFIELVQSYEHFDVYLYRGKVELIKKDVVDGDLLACGYSCIFQHLVVAGDSCAKGVERVLCPALLESFFEVGAELSIYIGVSKDSRSNSYICAVSDGGKLRVVLEPFYKSIDFGVSILEQVDSQARRSFRKTLFVLAFLSVISIGGAFIPALIAGFYLWRKRQAAVRQMILAKQALSSMPSAAILESAIVRFHK